MNLCFLQRRDTFATALRSAETSKFRSVESISASDVCSRNTIGLLEMFGIGAEKLDASFGSREQSCCKVFCQLNGSAGQKNQSGSTWLKQKHVAKAEVRGQSRSTWIKQKHVAKPEARDCSAALLLQCACASSSLLSDPRFAVVSVPLDASCQKKPSL